MLRAEQRLRPVNRQLLGAIGEFAATVISPAGITLGIFVREHRAHRFEHRFGNKVFRGNQLEARALASPFLAQDFGDFRIDFLQRTVHVL